MDTTENNDLSKDSKQELPQFTLKNVLNDLKIGFQALLFDSECNKIIIPILIFLESILSKIIIQKIEYTEIDYTAYMEQIHQIVKEGELNYENIYGGTGPLVYPAGHVFIYRILNIFTKGVNNIGAGQGIFGYIYTFSQCLTFIIFANLELPPWCFYLACLSKRLHSIYLLRMFNDCFATLYVLLMVVCFQYGVVYKKTYKRASKFILNILAPLFYSFAVSIKMNTLLYLPAVLIILYFVNDENLLLMIPSFFIMGLFQLIIAYPFLTNGEIIRSNYFKNAFDFKRKFMFKWSVNWKFLEESTFNDDKFHKFLLISHIIILSIVLFIKFLNFKQIGKSTFQLIKDGFFLHKSTITLQNIINNGTRLQATKFITTLLVLTNFIGVLFARSLHYQFLSWYAWTYPILLNIIFGNGVLGLVSSAIIYAGHEWCWNVYPSNKISSSVLIVLNSFVLIGCLIRLDLKTNDDEINSETKKEK